MAMMAASSSLNRRTGGQHAYDAVQLRQSLVGLSQAEEDGAHLGLSPQRLDAVALAAVGLSQQCAVCRPPAAGGSSAPPSPHPAMMTAAAPANNIFKFRLY